MKKSTYLLLSLILLSPFYSFSPSKKATPRTTDSYKYEFAYIAKPSTIAPGQYDITCYFIQLDLTTNTWTNPQSPTSYQITPNAGPFAGYTETYPTNLYNYTFYSLPWDPTNDVPCTITPYSYNGILVSQTIIPVSELP